VAEQRLLELLFADLEVLHAVLPRLQPDDYEGLPTAKLFQILLNFGATGQELSYENISPLIEEDSAVAEMLPLLLMGEIPDGSFEDRLTVADRCISALRLMQVHRRIDEVKLALADAQRANDENEVASLSLRQIELERLKTALLPVVEVFEIAQ
jgi:hypothetical protein